MSDVSTPMDYDTLSTYLTTILVIDPNSSNNYNTILPAAIQDAEQRIYRDMDFIATREVDSGSALTAGQRDFTLPTTNVTFLVVQGVSTLPVGGTLATAKATPLDAVSLDYIDSCHPDPTVQEQPTVWAMKDDRTICVGAWPDQNYPVVVTGTFRPASMSASNTTTYIGNIYPDLLVNACMVFLAGYQRDYGAQMDDPKLAMSWETKYQIALKTALSEEQRRKGQGNGWSQMSPTPEAAPPRT